MELRPKGSNPYGYRAIVVFRESTVKEKSKLRKGCRRGLLPVDQPFQRIWYEINLKWKENEYWSQLDKFALERRMSGNF